MLKAGLKLVIEIRVGLSKLSGAREEGFGGYSEEFGIHENCSSRGNEAQTSLQHSPEFCAGIIERPYADTATARFKFETFIFGYLQLHLSDDFLDELAAVWDATRSNQRHSRTARAFGPQA